MQDSILQLAGKRECWQEFLNYKREKQNLSKAEEKEIEDFIERKAYAPLCKKWEEEVFPYSPKSLWLV